MERSGNQGNDSQIAKRGVTQSVGAKTPYKQVGNY